MVVSCAFLLRLARGISEVARAMGTAEKFTGVDSLRQAPGRVTVAWDGG